MKKTPRRLCLRITLGSGRNKVTATFFNADYIKKGLTKNTRVMLSGEVGYFKGVMQLTHPAFLILDSPDGQHHGTKSLKSIADASQAISGELAMEEFERRFFPIYPASTKVQSWDIFKCVRQVLEVFDPVDEPLPAALRAEHGLISEDDALRAIHLAEDESEREQARRRLTFDEAVGLQWALVARRHGELSESGRRPGPIRRPGRRAVGTVAFRAHRGAARSARRVVRRAGGDPSDEPLAARRGGLGQDDRGGAGDAADGRCGLPVCAAGSYGSACRTASFVYQRCSGSAGDGGQLGGADNATRVALLTGSMTAGQKKQVRAEIASGQVGIVIGTHALLQDAVEFHNLGMVVVDEQHRFGVEQRDQLRAKAPAGITPHLLVMTATPIPRTVALTVYGDLETSTLRELPRGRQPITTNVIFVKDKPAWFDRAWQRIVEEVAAGRQAYVVAPRIDESDESDKAENGARPSATAVGLYSRLQAAELAGLRLALMHGRLSADEKEAAMAAFRAGNVDVLVCTTVIEVGVDVPNATVMLVMDADRFGISQLHQLRGRIGRGEHPSLCLLASWVSPGSPAGRRLRAVAETMDGFDLAELDLKERREGDVLGRNQSGKAITLRLLSLAEHRVFIEAARDFCNQAYQQSTGGGGPHPGLALMAARFTNTDRIDYLDKS
ncbi:helicase conserved C-terminal domain protein [Mycobacterium ulcerans str. Harvey]|uniref:Helicase conserved C-terminal domain protein n=1 Tax=Mycobacterium ulcerans str. Harvey TaxID=1299332 RepID=A0ABN0R0I5_MYCUL|nr:helicase conserved C-terminal domain protein [Mycobacterium ulcerans str. Harvey]